MPETPRNIQLASEADSTEFAKDILPTLDAESMGERAARLLNQLTQIDPNVDAEVQGQVLRALHHETDGGDEGLEVADHWLSQGSGYRGRSEVEFAWSAVTPAAQTVATLADLVSALTGVSKNPMACPGAQEPTPVLEVVEPANAPVGDSVRASNVLDQFSLIDLSHELALNSLSEVYVLGKLALQGQATVFFAAPNTGKTLITLALLTEAINNGQVDPANIYYANVDDTGSGLAEKGNYSDELRFNMLAEGHKGFRATSFLALMTEIVQSNQARGIVIILDTGKNFYDPMDKGKVSQFTKRARAFVMQGGTLIVLSHVNKKPGRDGKPIYAGTSDLVDDFDCAYTLAQVSAQAGVKVVEFENIKRRGSVAHKAAYSYSTESGISYSELLTTVRLVEAEELAPIKQAEQIRSDAEVIGAIEACIGQGVSTKMKLAGAVAVRAGVSKRQAIQVIEKYAGFDMAEHKWSYAVRDRGAKVFTLLAHERPAADGNTPRS